MLARLFSILLLTCLALPAAAMPLERNGEASVQVSAGSCHEQKAPADQHAPVQQNHDCIGCAPVPIQLTALPQSAELRGVIGASPQARFTIGLGSGPETPPPRI